MTQSWYEYQVIWDCKKKLSVIIRITSCSSQKLQDGLNSWSLYCYLWERNGVVTKETISYSLTPTVMLLTLTIWEPSSSSSGLLFSLKQNLAVFSQSRSLILLSARHNHNWKNNGFKASKPVKQNQNLNKRSSDNSYSDCPFSSFLVRAQHLQLLMMDCDVPVRKMMCWLHGKGKKDTWKENQCTKHVSEQGDWLYRAWSFSPTLEQKLWQGQHFLSEQNAVLGF